MRRCLLAFLLTLPLGGQTYKLSTLAGVDPPIGLVPSASIGNVQGLAIAPSGDFFFTSNGRVLRTIGSSSILLAASLPAAYSLAVTLNGTLYISEPGRIRRLSGGVLSTVAGTGVPGLSGDGGPAIDAAVDPVQLALDAAGNLYFTNRAASQAVTPTLTVNAGVVRRIANGIITTVAGKPTCCDPSSPDGVPAASAQLYELTGIAVNAAGEIFVASNANPYNHGGIRRIANGVVTTVAGGGESTDPAYQGPANAASFTSLSGLAFNPDGDLFFSDVSANVVRKLSNGTVSTVAGTGQFGYTGGGPATSARLSSPGAIAFDLVGRMYFVDTGNYAIRQVIDGIIDTEAGNGEFSYRSDGGPVDQAQFNGPVGLDLAPDGSMYIADTLNGRVRRILGDVIYTVAGGGTWIPGPANSAALASPRDVAADGTGAFYVLESGPPRIRKVAKGILTTVAVLDGPADHVAVDAAGVVYFTAQNSVRKIENGKIVTVAGAGEAGFSGDGGPATAARVQPTDIAFGPDGALYIADGPNHRVRKVSNGIITTVAGTGIEGATGDGGAAMAAQLSNPFALAFDASGELFVAVTGAIRRIANGVITTIATSVSPKGLVADAAGNVYFSEGNVIRVLKRDQTGCSYSVTPATILYPAQGATVTIRVETTPQCGWLIEGLGTSSTSGLTASVTGGIGSGDITITFAATAGAGGLGITVAGTRVIAQAAGVLQFLGFPTLPTAFAGTEYTASLTTSGGVPPLSWKLDSGVLAPGLQLSQDGTLSGTPTQPGQYRFQVKIKDASDAFLLQSFTLVVSAQTGGTEGSISIRSLPFLGPFMIDATGNVYTVGSSGTPTAGAAQTQHGGGSCVLNRFVTVRCDDVFIGKSTPDGQPVFGTWLGGDTADGASAMAVDTAGNVYVAGRTNGLFPTTPGALRGSTPGQAQFAAKLSADGSRFLYSTNLPEEDKHVSALAVDGAGHLYVALNSSVPPATILELNETGSSILNSITLPGITITGMTFDPSGNLVATGAVTGSLPLATGTYQATSHGGADAFVLKLDASLAPLAATYLGGSGVDTGLAVRTDSAGNVVILGSTLSNDFPAPSEGRRVPLSTNDSTQYFVARFPSDLRTLTYAQYLEGLAPSFLALGPDGAAYVAGTTNARLLISLSAPQPCAGGQNDIYLARLDESGKLADATYVGGASNEYAYGLTIAPNGTALLAFQSSASTAPSHLASVRFGGPGWSAPVCISDLRDALTMTVAPGIAPGEFVTLIGFGLGPDEGVAYQLDAAGRIPSELAGVRVFDGKPAPVLYVSSRQVNVQAPFGIQNTTTIALEYRGVVFGPQVRLVVAGVPAVFRREPDLSIRALAFNQDNTANSDTNPAARGSFVYFYAGGLGATSPGCSEGGPNVPVAAALASGSVAIGNTGPVLYAGSAPGMPCGVQQVNFRVPDSVSPGGYALQLYLNLENQNLLAQQSAVIYVK